MGSSVKMDLKGLNVLDISKHQPKKTMTWSEMTGPDMAWFMGNLMFGMGTVAAGALAIGALLPRHVSLGVAAAALCLPALRLLLVKIGIKPPNALLTRSQRVPVVLGRTTAHIDGDFIVFLLGTRMNMSMAASLEAGKWAGDAFTAMLVELTDEGSEKLGCLGAFDFIGASVDAPSTLIVMYWRSYDHLLAWSRSAASKHLPGWKGLHEIGRRDANYGFWHETFSVRAGEYESIYVNCPAMMLGGCAGARLLPATGPMLTSANRLRNACEAASYTAQVEADAAADLANGSTGGKKVQ